MKLNDYPNKATTALGIKPTPKEWLLCHLDLGEGKEIQFHLMMITCLGCIYFAPGYAEWKKVGKSFQRHWHQVWYWRNLSSYNLSLELLQCQADIRTIKYHTWKYFQNGQRAQWQDRFLIPALSSCMLVGKVFKIIFSVDEIFPLMDLNVLISLENWLGLVISFRWCRNCEFWHHPWCSISLRLSSVHNLIETAISEEIAMLAPLWLPSSERQVHAQSVKYLKFLRHVLCLMLDSFNVTFRL